MPNGDVVVGGEFTAVGAVAAFGLARWDGTTWSEFGGGAYGVRTMLVEPNGDLVVGGLMTTAGGLAVQGIARWDGAVWSSIGAGVPLVISGDPGELVQLRALLNLPGGGFLLGGRFVTAGDQTVANLVRCNGTAWSMVGDGINGSPGSFVELSNGDLIATGAFTTIGPGVTVPGIARRSNGVWTPFAPPPGGVAVMALLPGDKIALAGGFPVPGGVCPASLWNGTTWATLGSIPSALPMALQVMPNGDLIASGIFGPAGTAPTHHVTRWNGTTWTPLFGFPSPIQTLAHVRALAVLPNGNLVAGSVDGLLGGLPAAVAVWNGSSWTKLGPGFGTAVVAAVGALPNGDIVAGGGFTSVGATPVNYIARWNGTAWVAMGAAIPGVNGFMDLVVLPDGDVIAAFHHLVAGVQGFLLARWDGSSWTTISSGSGIVREIALLPSGRLLVGGTFDSIGGVLSPWLAEAIPSCPATVVSYGTTCSPITLSATRPWLGGPWKLSCAGLPAGTAVLRVLGVPQVSIPLPSLIPTSLPGCDLLVFPDFLDASTASGTYTSQLDLPDLPSLAGLAIHCQLVLTGPGLGGPGVATIGTNALQSILGSL